MNLTPVPKIGDGAAVFHSRPSPIHRRSQGEKTTFAKDPHACGPKKQPFSKSRQVAARQGSPHPITRSFPRTAGSRRTFVRPLRSAPRCSPRTAKRAAAHQPKLFPDGYRNCEYPSALSSPLLQELATELENRGQSAHNVFESGSRIPAKCPVPPGTSRRAHHCLAACSLVGAPFGAQRLLLRPHSPTTPFPDNSQRIAVLSPGRPHQAPSTIPARIVVPVLVLTFIQSFTSLAGVTRRT